MDSKPQDNTDLSSQYQAILDQYANELKSLNKNLAETPPKTPLPLPDDAREPIAAVPESLPESPAPTPAASPVTPTTDGYRDNIPEKPIVSTPPVSGYSSIPVTEIKSSSNLFKYFFYFSVLVFFGVFAAIVYALYSLQTPPTSQASLSDTPTLTPRPTVSDLTNSFCEVNDQKFRVGENFTAADKCNTCTCGNDLIITCTDKVCDSPVVSTPGDNKITNLFEIINKLIGAELTSSTVNHNFPIENDDTNELSARSVDLSKYLKDKAKLASIRKIVLESGFEVDQSYSGDSGAGSVTRYFSENYYCDLLQANLGGQSKLELICAENKKDNGQ